MLAIEKGQEREYLRLARQVASSLKHRYTWINVDDLFDYAQLGSWLAVKAYKPQSGVPLAKYAVWRAAFFAVDEMRKDRLLHRGNRPAQVQVTLFPQGEIDIAESLSAGQRAGSDPAGQAERKDLCEFLLRKLCVRDRQILQMYYHDGMTFKEIGHVLNISEAMVSIRHKEVLRRLRCLGRSQAS